MLLEPGQEDLADFLAAHRVRIAASLPCYSAANVDEQRGGGVFQRSIEVIERVLARNWQHVKKMFVRTVSSAVEGMHQQRCEGISIRSNELNFLEDTL